MPGTINGPVRLARCLARGLPIRCLRGESDGEVGAALLITLVLALLLAAMGGSLLMLSDSETSAASNFQAGTQVLYAAEAMLAHVVAELSAISDWSALPGGALRSAIDEGLPRPVTAWHQTLDLAAATAALQSDSDDGEPGPTRPRWRIFGSSSFSALTGVPLGASPEIHLVSWLADDESDGDGDPGMDANAVVQVRTWAIDARGLQRSVQAVIRREEAAGVVILSWREVLE